MEMEMEQDLESPEDEDQQIQVVQEKQAPMDIEPSQDVMIPFQDSLFQASIPEPVLSIQQAKGYAPLLLKQAHDLFDDADEEQVPSQQVIQQQQLEEEYQRQQERRKQELQQMEVQQQEQQQQDQENNEQGHLNYVKNQTIELSLQEEQDRQAILSQNVQNEAAEEIDLDVPFMQSGKVQKPPTIDKKYSLDDIILDGIQDTAKVLKEKQEICDGGVQILRSKEVKKNGFQKQKKNVLDLESNDEEEDDDDAIQFEFKQTEKFASIVISDGEEEEPEVQIQKKFVRPKETPQQKIQPQAPGPASTPVESAPPVPVIKPVKVQSQQPSVQLNPSQKQQMKSLSNAMKYIQIDEDMEIQAPKIQVKQKIEDAGIIIHKPRNDLLGLIIHDELENEDDNQVQDMELQTKWNPINQMMEIPTLKFQGAKSQLPFDYKSRGTIKAFFGDQKFLNMLNGIKEEHFWLWLGTRMMMAYMKLPDINDYFHQEDWLAGGGIRSVITQETFEEVDFKIEILMQPLNSSQLAIKLEQNTRSFFYQEQFPAFVQELNEKFNKALQPGQELMVIMNSAISPFCPKIDWYQLIDKETGFILNQFFWNTTERLHYKDVQKRLRQMFAPYHLKKHIVYAQQGIFDAESVLLLASSKVYICTELNQHSLLPQQPQQMSYFEHQHKAMYLLYKDQTWVTFISTQSLRDRANNMEFFNQQLFNNQKLYIQPPLIERLQPNKILFTFVLESIIGNMHALDRQTTFKQFRSDLALKLLEREIDYKQPIPLSHKPKVLQIDQISQTDHIIGVQLDKLVHIPIIDSNARCLVCLKAQILTKTNASCWGCSEGLKHKICLCIYPCFRLFHLNPKEYLADEDYYQITMGYEQFDQEDENDEHLPLKPETLELDKLYAQNHLDFNEDLMNQYGVPINYEDDYSHKTKFKFIHTKKPLKKSQGGGGGRPRGNPQSEPRKGRPKKNPIMEQSIPKPAEENPESSKVAMMDFFSMVRKKIQQQSK